MDKKTDETAHAAAPFKERFAAFQELLVHNNAALGAMADLGEKLTGEYLFDRAYVSAKTREVSDHVGGMVASLNLVCADRYASLTTRHAEIVQDIERVIGQKRTVSEDRLIVPLGELSCQDTDRVGGKMANLGELRTKLSLPTPDGFAITAFAFQRFLDHNKLAQKIAEKLNNIPENDLTALEKISIEIQDMVRNATLPDDLSGELSSAYERIAAGARTPVMVSVRSSALLEDGEFSFAGQYATALNVAARDIPARYKDVVASLFNQRALFYGKTKGLSELDMVMPVGVLRMIEARAGGVMYSRDPNRPQSDEILISAVRGLGVCVVDGTVSPHTWTVSRESGKSQLTGEGSSQGEMAVCLADGGIERRLIDPSVASEPCLTDSQISQLSHYADTLERHYGCPQDIEWAIEPNGSVVLLQSRPLTITARELKKPVPTRVPGHEIRLNRGVIACKGIAFGPIHLVRLDEDLKTFPDGGVLLAKHTSTKFVTVMDRASAIITDVGSTAGHMASIAREFQVPTILDAENATTLFTQGELVTVDAINCNVYEGTVEELRPFSTPKDDPLKSTHLFKTLQRALRLISPLNLIDPEAPEFRPEACRTLHDITRFCHEMAVRELFNIEHISADDVGSQKLVAAIPTDIWVLDLGGAIDGNPKHLNSEHLRCIPFQALFKGLTSMRWPEAKQFDVSGFMGAIAHTATTSEEQLRRSAEKSFAILSEFYMTFAIRLGYHLSTIEAFAGEHINDNYVRFHFKGGGAAVDRRLRRVRLIGEILKHMDFNVRIVDDVVDASLMKYKQETILEKLEIMGKFTVFTKQLDMVMYNDAITDGYIKQFIKQHMPNKSL